jgi:hypothetical protein
VTDFYWPTLLEPAASRLEIMSSAGRFVSPTSGFTRTISRPGERMRLTLNFENTNSAKRAAIQYALARMQGATHRIWAHDHSNRIRGSFPNSELFSNNTFANGTTDWITGSDYTISTHDRVCRAVRSAVTGQANVIRRNSGAPATVTQYAPYALRLFRRDVRNNGSTYLFRIGSTFGGTEYLISGTHAAGLATEVFVALASSAFFDYRDSAASAVMPFENIIDIPWVSCSRCALVDNGGNLLLQSDDFTTTWANVRSTDAANSTAAPDGQTTADSIIEDATASNTHYIEQTVTIPSAAADYCLIMPLKAGTRSWAVMQLQETAGSTVTNVWCNLATGAFGTTAVGANFSNLRTFSVNLGNGWFAFCAVVRKTNASTGFNVRIYMSTGDGVSVYTGDGASLIYAWRPTLLQSSFPTRLTATTTAAVAAAAQALSGPLHTKGWPVSTNGLLLPGDQVQIGNQIHIVTSPVNSDAAGRATLDCYPARRSAPAENVPIIVNQPMGKFFLESDANGWGNKPGIFSDAEIVLAEAA